MGERVAILRRFMKDGKRMRELDCGHTQEEKGGGKSGTACWATCFTCNPRPSTAATTEACGAIVLPQFADGKARPCGQPAAGLKRGEPRCKRHLSRGS